MSARLLEKPASPSFRDGAGNPCLPSVRISVELTLLLLLSQVTPHAPPPPGGPIFPLLMGQPVSTEGGHSLHSPTSLFFLSGWAGIIRTSRSISIVGNSPSVISIGGVLLVVCLASWAGWITGQLGFTNTTSVAILILF